MAFLNERPRAARVAEVAVEQGLLIKRRDEHARPGSDVVAELPQSVISGSTLDQI